MATTSIGSVEYVYKKEILQWIKGLHTHTAQDIGNNFRHEKKGNPLGSLFIKSGETGIHRQQKRVLANYQEMPIYRGFVKWLIK